MLVGLFLGINLTMIAVTDGRTELEIRCAQHRQAATILTGVIKDALAVDKDCEIESSLEEIYEETIGNLDCYSAIIVTPKQMRENYNSYKELYK